MFTGPESKMPAAACVERKGSCRQEEFRGASRKVTGLPEGSPGARGKAVWTVSKS